jgi:hypothetical protein
MRYGKGKIMKTKILTCLFIFFSTFGLYAQILPENPKVWEMRINLSKTNTNLKLTMYTIFIKSTGKMTVTTTKDRKPTDPYKFEEKKIDLNKKKIKEFYKVVRVAIDKFKIKDREVMSDKAYMKRLKNMSRIFILINVAGQNIQVGDDNTNLKERPEFKALIDLINSELAKEAKIKIP